MGRAEERYCDRSTSAITIMVNVQLEFYFFMLVATVSGYPVLVLLAKYLWDYLVVCYAM